MSERTGISWCDSTHNAWMGCTKVSPACDHCYAERDMDTRLGKVKWGAGQPRQRTSEKNRNLPLRWNRADFRQCGDCGWRGEIDTLESDTCPSCEKHERLEPARRRVFSSSLSDWLDKEVPIEWLVDLLEVIWLTPNLDWLLLTKRIGYWRSRMMLAVGIAEVPMRTWLTKWLDDGTPPPNVWIGATVENQEVADRDIPKLLRVPAAVRFLSIEPMLGPIHLRPDFITRWPNRQADVHSPGPPLDWIIVGGESGPNARPMHPDWVRSLRDQCTAAGVPFHFKQHGEWLPFYDRDKDDPDWRNVPKLDNQMERGAERWINLAGGIGFHGERLVAMRNVGKKAAGRVLDGRTWDEFPRSAA